MKAVVVNKEGTWVELVERDIRKPGYGEALVDVEYCGVCHTDLQRFRVVFWDMKVSVL